MPGACAQGPVVHCNSESTVMFSCTLALGRQPSYCASVQRTIHDRDELVGPRPALPMPQGALRRQDMQALGSPTVDLRGELIYRGLSSDRAGRLRSIRTSKFSSKSIFLLCGKCSICDFPSETSATPLPPFRNALRLEKNCELMRCSLTRASLSLQLLPWSSLQS